jgi:hypothetical protein
MEKPEVINPKPAERMEFTRKDFELCFEQLKFYDDRQISALKYIFLISSGAASLVFTVYGLVETANPVFFGFLAFLAFVIFLTTLILYCSALQNRIYFVLTAGHINRIRKYFMYQLIPDDYYYYERRFALNWKSAHTYIMVGSTVFSALFLGLFVYFIRPASGQTASIRDFIITVVATAVIETATGMAYWYYRDRQAKRLEKP